jgi:Icc-related predicted phosphoesterase
MNGLSYELADVHIDKYEAILERSMTQPVTIAAISDTHGKHREIAVPECDILIHAGDISNFDRREHYVDFFEWFATRDAQHLVLVGGNHDQYFVDRRDHNEYLLSYPGIHYLENEGVELMGLRIWGSPVQSDLFDMAFCYSRRRRTQEWAKVPDGVDVLVSHCPPLSVLDQNMEGISTGCDILMDTIRRIKPKLTLFGHIHEAYGVRAKDIDGTTCTFANCSVVNRWRKVENEPWLFKIEDGEVFYS